MGFPSPAETCYLIHNDTQTKDTAMPEDGRPNLEGLRIALAVQEAGGWHEYEGSPQVPGTEQDAMELLKEILAVKGPTDMPGDPDLLLYLVDAAAALHGERSRADGWRILGVQPSMGRKFVTNSGRVAEIHWPLWFTAVAYGLGFARHASRESYDTMTSIEVRH